MNESRAFQAIIEHFKNNGWRFQVDEARRLVRADFTGRNGLFRCLATVDEDDEVLLVLTILPVTVPLHKRAAIAELCVRASFGMKQGRFEMDYSDGEVRFLASSAYPAGQLADAVIRRVVGVNLAMADAHFPAFMGVLFADVPPAAALRQLTSVTAKPGVAGQLHELRSPSRISLN